jgi:membrane-bound lytic murein transglycosylase A
MGLFLRGPFRPARARWKPSIVLLLLAILDACAPAPPSVPPPSAPPPAVGGAPALQLRAVAFADLPGWREDSPAAALAAFRRSCARILALAPNAGLAPAEIAGRAQPWQQVCRKAAELPAGSDAAARAFFEGAFQPYALADGGGSEGFFTGYYLPRVAGSRRKMAGYDVPLYRRPPDLATPYFSRAEIDAGALAGRGLELVWLASPIDAFFVSVQGSATVALSDGSVMRIGVAGTNGLGYVAIGRILIARGEIPAEQMSLQSLRAWLIAHPGEAKGLMEQNPRYVFFRELPGADPIGSEGVALTAGRSLAVDPAFLPLGAPIYVATTDGAGGALRRLMLAQDTGSAIKGPLRADVYWGGGEDAEALAGPMKSPGSLYLLLPKGVAASGGS